MCLNQFLLFSIRLKVRFTVKHNLKHNTNPNNKHNTKPNSKSKSTKPPPDTYEAGRPRDPLFLSVSVIDFDAAPSNSKHNNLDGDASMIPIFREKDESSGASKEEFVFQDESSASSALVESKEVPLDF